MLVKYARSIFSSIDISLLVYLNFNIWEFIFFVNFLVKPLTILLLVCWYFTFWFFKAVYVEDTNFLSYMVQIVFFRSLTDIFRVFWCSIFSWTQIYQTFLYNVSSFNVILERSFDLPNCINIYLHLVFDSFVIFKWWGIYFSIRYKMNTNFLNIFSNWPVVPPQKNCSFHWFEIYIFKNCFVFLNTLENLY